MKWTCEQIEDIMNYLRVCKNVNTIFMLDIDGDRIGYFDNQGNGTCKKFSNIYKEMLDNQKEV